MKTYHKFMEYFWLAIALLTTIYAGLSLQSAGWEKTDNMLLFMPIISLALYGTRRWHNRRRAREERQG
jgi:hypothetical protein